MSEDKDKEMEYKIKNSNSLPGISIRNPVFAWMLMAALILFGTLFFRKMGISQLPDVDFPVVNVSVSYPGAAPEVMEVDVIDILEDAVTSVQGIKTVTASCKSGSANLNIEFDINKDINVAAREVESAIARAKRKLPKDVEDPIVSKFNTEDQPILWLAITLEKDAALSTKDLMVLVRDQIKDYFTMIEGVGEAYIGGLIDPILKVDVSPLKLQGLELTAVDVISTIQAEHVEVPSGRLKLGNRELNIRTMGEVTDADKFAKLAINKRGGSPNFKDIRLNQVALVEEGLDESRKTTRVDGKMAVGIAIKKQRGANAIDVAHRVKAQLTDLQKILPPGVTVSVRFDLTKFVEDAIHELNFTLILAAILTALLCWLFLGSWTATLNIILAIPTSIIGSFIVLYYLGFTLNTFTLLALSLAIGIVVDDAIMVLENIVRHRENGQSRRFAAFGGAFEIAFAALAATAAIVAIFLPVAFMDGLIGKFFFQFGVTLSVAVLFSLLEALTLTPMRCAQFLSIKPRTSFIGHAVETTFKNSSAFYSRVLKVVLNHRYKTIALSLIFFVASFGTLKFLKKEMTPPQDMSMLMVRGQAPVGSSPDYTAEKFLEVEKILAAHPNVEHAFITLGMSDGNAGMVFVNLKEKKNRNPKQSHLEIAEDIRKSFKASTELQKMKMVVQDPSQGGMGGGGGGGKKGFPIEFNIQGGDWTYLMQYAADMMKAMEKSKMMMDIDSDFKGKVPEIQVVPDRTKARLYGVSINDIGQTLNVMMGGVEAATFSKNNHRLSVMVRMSPEERTGIEVFKKLSVRNNRGELIPLSDLVKIEEAQSLQNINRENRQRVITITANVAKGVSQEEAMKKVEELGKTVVGPGYNLVPTGSAKTYKETFLSLLLALFLGIIVSYMVLASQFNSYIHPFTVLVALPFSISGAFLSLLATSQSLNMYSMIGLILLMGIVKKNSILLVDFTNQRRLTDNLSVKDALLVACPIRLRPILMTSLATIASAIPAAISLGPGAETRMPMAIAVIGGVLVSTLLTLVVVPCVYSVLSGLESKVPADFRD